VSDEELDVIRHLDVPSIALEKAPSKQYKEDKNITSLVYPIYCEKMYHAFIEALKMTPHDDEKYVQKYKQRRFNGHILVAEDNIANQEFIKIILERFGLSYYIASDGLEAVQTFKIASFDLVFMDKQMPVKDGVEATKDILVYEESKGKKHTPIVGLSADVSEGEGPSFGHDGFLGKPLVIKEFEVILKKYLVENKSLEKEIVPASFSANKVDLSRLKEELMLDESEVKLLLQTFRDKMKKSFPILSLAVDNKNYKKISLEAHSIKGSSANFRFENLEHLAKSMELSARREDVDFDYKKVLDEMEQIMAELI
jgi:CheY-like chemotaxis protein